MLKRSILITFYTLTLFTIGIGVNLIADRVNAPVAYGTLHIANGCNDTDLWIAIENDNRVNVPVSETIAISMQTGRYIVNVYFETAVNVYPKPVTISANSLTLLAVCSNGRS